MNAKRQEIQNKFKKDTAELSSGDILIAEVKTGTGKTRMLIERAIQAVKDGYIPIISTSNNFLALEFLQEAKDMGIPENDLDIIIGKSNYFSKEYALSDLFLSEFSLSRKDVESWIKNSPYLLTDLFIDEFDLPDEAREFISCEEGRKINDTISKIFSNEKVYITNHFYLIPLMKALKDHDSSSIMILSDEVHLLHGAAQASITSSFSIYKIKTFLSISLNEDNGLSKALRKDMVKVSRIMGEQLSYLTTKYIKRGDGFFDFSDFNNMKELLSDTLVESVMGQLKKKKKLSGSIDKVLSEYNEGKKVFSYDWHRNFEISLSAIKAYPSFKVMNEDPVYFLRKIFLSFDGIFLGVSGTILVGTSESINENLWSMHRLGLMLKSTDTDRRNLDNVKLIIYESIFDKSETMYHVARSSAFAPPAYTVGAKNKEHNEKKYRNWIRKLASLADEKFWRNGVILMSSFENVEIMEDELLKLSIGKEYKIFSQTQGKTMKSVIDSYRKSVDSGQRSILIGGLNFYTGIDFHGKYLSTLFIGKLPIEPQPSLMERKLFRPYTVMADLKNKALVTFRQGLGRAKRRAGDRTYIVVADPRIISARYNIFLHFLDKFAREEID